MKRIRWNSPVVLWFTVLSGVILLLNTFTNGTLIAHYFTIYRSSFSDPLLYLRLFTHVLGHANYTHYANNMLLFLLVGPLLEEKYGSKKLLSIILTVAFVTGFIHILISPKTGLLGASGVVFSFVLLSSVTGTKKNNDIPLTLLIVATIYIIQQIYQAVTLNNNVSYLTHMIGGSIGAVYGLAMRQNRR